MEGGGHEAGDASSALEAQRAVRLVRNILMAADNTYLGFDRRNGFLWKRWIGNIQFFQPDIDGRYVQNVTGARIALNVRNKMLDFYICSKKGCRWHGLNQEDINEIRLEDSMEW